MRARQQTDYPDAAAGPPAATQAGSRRPGAPSRDRAGQDGPATAAARPPPDVDDSAVPRDPAAVRAFIERFTAQLAQAGFPRTPARIFVALLTADSSSLTAAELSELLQASPASVSSGARYLLQVGLVHAEGEPGSRRLHYRMSTAVWQDVVALRDRQFHQWAAELRRGAEVLGPGTPAGARLADTVRYFEFISGEMTGLLARWRAQSSGTESGSGH